MDCRLPHDPADIREQRNHCGTFPQTVAGFVQNEGFSNWLKDFLFKCHRLMHRIQLERGERSTGPSASLGPGSVTVSRVTMVFYCKRGHHRSVAGALIGAHLLEATVGCLAPRKVDHLCQAFWHTACGTACDRCNTRSAERTEALANARVAWAKEMAAF